ncbi:MAG: hypothetical protein JO274_12215 [Gammaproteobacteria bacterium]|nr:hypothetical protein [Gammaproteobacteria bacterium]
MRSTIDAAADVADRHLQRLEHRYRRAQGALSAATALYTGLRGNPGTHPTQLHHAQRSVEEAERYLGDLRSAIERAEEQTAAA